MERSTMTGTGLVHLYSGDGKGKTTAGMGLCIRAAGHGFRVLICQFLKDGRSGEREAMEQIPGITFMPVPDQVPFTFRMSPEEKEAARDICSKMLEEAFCLVRSGNYDVLFLDEIVYAIRTGMADEERLVRFLEEKPEKLEVIMTGQDPGERLAALTDYHSEIRALKHPFRNGQQARTGIEY